LLCHLRVLPGNAALSPHLIQGLVIICLQRVLAATGGPAAAQVKRTAGCSVNDLLLVTVTACGYLSDQSHSGHGFSDQ